jgi:hypothetical protein
MLQSCPMRTTLTIDDDVLVAAKGLAARQRNSVGEVISSLARAALRPASTHGRTRNGVPLLPKRKQTKPVTADLVRQLHDELP